MALALNTNDVAQATLYPVETLVRHLATLEYIAPVEYDRIIRTYHGILPSLDCAPYDAYPYNPETFGNWSAAYWSVIYSMLEDVSETVLALMD